MVDDRKQKILIFLKKNGESSTSKIQKETKIPFYVVKFVLEELRKEKAIKFQKIQKENQTFTYWNLA